MTDNCIYPKKPPAMFGGFFILRRIERSMVELHRGDELRFKITDAAFEELEACECNMRSVLLFKRT